MHLFVEINLHHLYRHDANRTVEFEILKRYYVPETKVWKLKVAWWVISSKRPPCPMLISQKIEIPLAKVREWLPMGWHDRGPASVMEVL